MISATGAPCGPASRRRDSNPRLRHSLRQSGWAPAAACSGAGRHPPALHAGVTLPGASSWTVITTPGHTDAGITFWHADSRTSFSGDTVHRHRRHFEC
ncbi:MBL fold metallo-hydrolase [Mycobacterium sp. AZCC_0083]|uniref:MBL fold metallo-hydrolase n=1 Tax=Mycobacterium sp. AZCC_0083 TaxID=2735882 RepID=UPI0035C9A8E3